MRPSPAALAKLTDYQAWAHTGPTAEPITLFDYVSLVSTPDLLFGFADLFWPDLVVHEDLHFLASGFTADVFGQWVTAGCSPREIQRVMNHVHMSTLLQQRVVSDELAVEAARVVGAIWTRTLGPEGLIVEVVGTSLDDAAVTFFEGGPSSSVPSSSVPCESGARQI